MTTAQFSRDDILIYQGREEGWTAGKAEGKAESKMEEIIDFLEDIGDVPDVLRNLIMAQTDIDILHKWLKAAAKAESVEEFERMVGLVSASHIN